MKTQAVAKTDSSGSVLEYELLTTHVDDFEQMSYTTYGIKVSNDKGNVIKTYADISTSKEYVQGFLDMIKGRDVAAVHIADILDDYLD